MNAILPFPSPLPSAASRADGRSPNPRQGRVAPATAASATPDGIAVAALADEITAGWAALVGAGTADAGIDPLERSARELATSCAAPGLQRTRAAAQDLAGKLARLRRSGEGFDGLGSLAVAYAIARLGRSLEPS